MSRKSVCHCPAYAWPHRRGSGQCIWSPRHSEAHCTECGQPCNVLVGKLDAHEVSPGSPRTYACSSCCSAPAVREGEEITFESA
jgi:hypothetical protein